MQIIVPTEGSDSGTWDTILNTALGTTIDQHDHTTGNGVQVPTAGIDIDADLTFAGNNATNVGVVGFTQIASTVINNSLHVKSSDGELYWRTTGGTDVRVTNGASLDLTLAGGITGDYSSTNADLEYVDAEKAYEFKQDESPDHWANIKAGDIRIAEPTSGVVNFVTLESPTSLAASYTLELPDALPASDQWLVLTSAGKVRPSVPVDTEWKYDLFDVDTTATSWTFSGALFGRLSTSAITTECRLMLSPLPLGWSIQSVTCRASETTATDTIEFRLLYRIDGSGEVTLATGQTTGAGVQDVTITPGTPEVIVEARDYIIECESIGAGGGVRAWHWCKVTFDHT